MAHMLRLICFCSLLLTLFSCKKDQIPNYAIESNEFINTWVLDSMRRYYLWSEELPGSPNITSEPKIFFGEIKNKNDRFSQLYLPNDPASFEASSRSAYGFDYVVLKDETSNTFFGVVKLVLKESPAERAGLQRGMFITAVNKKTFTNENINSLYQELVSSNVVNLTIQSQLSNRNTEQELEIHAGLSFEQPVISSLLLHGAKKIGYVYIDHFSFGLTTTLQPIIEQFKSQGIEQLIIDLRYNLGGEVSEAAGLSALLAPGIEYNSPFIVYQGNRNGGTRKESFGEAATFDGLINFGILQTVKLNLPKIYILTSGSTASAAEIVINCLKPYMEVVTIGEKTTGKDLASFLIKDFSSPQKVAWEIQPIIYKLYNAKDIGDYGEGLLPTVEISELGRLPLPALGDTGDLLIETALQQMDAVQPKTQHLNRINKPTLKFDSQSDRAVHSVVLTHR